MPAKKTDEAKPKQDDEMLLNILSQLDILTQSIKMIDSDMEVLTDKVSKLSSRLGL